MARAEEWSVKKRLAVIAAVIAMVCTACQASAPPVTSSETGGFPGSDTGVSTTPATAPAQTPLKVASPHRTFEGALICSTADAGSGIVPIANYVEYALDITEATRTLIEQQVCLTASYNYPAGIPADTTMVIRSYGETYDASTNLITTELIVDLEAADISFEVVTQMPATPDKQTGQWADATVVVHCLPDDELIYGPFDYCVDHAQSVPG